MGVDRTFFHSIQFLSLLIVLCRLLFAPFILPPVATSSSDCRLVNDDVDRALENAKHMIAHDVGVIADKGYTRKLDLNILGLRFPVVISLNASSGRLTSYETMIRTGDATVCRSTVANSLEGSFTYEKDLRLSYDFMTVKLLNWEIKGSMAYRMQPDVTMTVTHKIDECRLGSFSLENTGETAYEVVTGNSWTNRVVDTMIRFALGQHDSSLMLSKVTEGLQNNVNSFFVPIWCDIMNTII